MPPRNNLNTACCWSKMGGGKAEPRLDNLMWDLMTGPPWGFHMVNISQSSPTVELAHVQHTHPLHGPCRARPSVRCLLWAERYLTSPHDLWSSRPALITGSGLQPRCSLGKLVVVRLTAERSGGCVLWVAGLCSVISMLAVSPQRQTHTHTHTHTLTYGNFGEFK